jgi:hypothetical protein
MCRNVVVASTNGNVHYNECHVKITIKNFDYLQASIAMTKNLIILTIEDKWLDAMLGMLEGNFFNQPHPKQTQLLNKTKLWGKFILTTTFQLASFEEHIE